jgi:hypothetical protein
MPGQPAPPADLEPLLQVELVDGQRDVGGRDDTKHSDLADEDIPIVILQRIEEAILPLVQDDIDRD